VLVIMERAGGDEVRAAFAKRDTVCGDDVRDSTAGFLRTGRVARPD
jgi:hypothetical protein